MPSRAGHVRYYVIPSPSATQRLLLGLLEAPPSWTPDAIDVVVQFLPRNWMQIHFLRAIGTAMSIGARIAAAVLLF
ncbi:protein GIGANTEA [Tanacetum coccineum]